MAGTARLRIVAVAAAISFLCPSLLQYALPLYFPAAGLPDSSWERWCSRTIFAWMCGPAIAAVIANRIGERRAWALGLGLYTLLPVALWFLPMAGEGTPWLMDAAALYYGAVAALIWIGGISLTQIVPRRRKSLSNAATMTAVALGAAVAPQIGRALLLGAGGRTSDVAASSFHGIFIVFAAVSAGGAVLVYTWGQRRGAENGGSSEHGNERSSLRASLPLLRSGRFVATIIALGFLTGPVYQATNAYRAYRAAEPYIGLIVAAQDHGFAFMQSAGYVGQLLGGLLIGLLAGRRANRFTGALILGSFTVCQLGIGLAPGPVVLIACSALFEMMRQVVRWSQTGFISELVPETHRGPAISVTVMLSGMGGWLFMVLTRALQSPDSSNFSSTLPFLIATVSGVVGVGMLLFTQQRVRRRS